MNLRYTVEYGNISEGYWLRDNINPTNDLIYFTPTELKQIAKKKEVTNAKINKVGGLSVKPINNRPYL